MHCPGGAIQLHRIIYQEHVILFDEVSFLPFFNLSSFMETSTRVSFWADTLSTSCKQICILSVQTVCSHTLSLTSTVGGLGVLCNLQLMCRAGTGLMRAGMEDISMAMSLKKRTMTSYLW